MPNTLLYKISIRYIFDGRERRAIHSLDVGKALSKTLRALVDAALALDERGKGPTTGLYSSAYRSMRDHLDRVRLSTF